MLVVSNIGIASPVAVGVMLKASCHITRLCFGNGVVACPVAPYRGIVGCHIIGDRQVIAKMMRALEVCGQDALR